MTDVAQQHKSRLLEYFDGIGFERWAAIYGEAEVSRIRRTIRAGHATMLALAEQWLTEAVGSVQVRRANGALPTILDAGCGTGLLTIALAQRGFDVTAVDIAPQMVAATRRGAEAAGVAAHVDARSDDLEAIGGAFDAVACLDVLVHYPQPSFAQLCSQLAQRTRGSLVFTYAPHEPVLAALHWLGGRFPKSQRRTEIQMIPRAFVEQTLSEAGMRVHRTARVSHGFYHVTLLEARRETDVM